MKKYEYKFVKKEGPEYNNLGSIKSMDPDAILLTGYGLEGWRVHSPMGGYWLLERDIQVSEHTQ